MINVKSQKRSIWNPIVGGITHYKVKEMDGISYCIVSASFIRNLGPSRSPKNNLLVASISNDFRAFEFDKSLDLRFNIMIDQTKYKETVQNSYHPLFDFNRLKNLKTNWILIGENLEFKLKDGKVYFRFNPSLILGDSSTIDSILVSSNRNDTYFLKKLFDLSDLSNIHFFNQYSKSNRLNKKEKNYLKCLTLKFNCFIMNYRQE